MRRILMLTLAGLILVFAHTAAFAADTGQVQINATVLGTCKFTTGGGSTTINVTLDPSVGGPVTGTGSLTFWCTKNSSFSVSDDDGLYESGSDQNKVYNSAANEYIPYTFSYSPTSGTGNGPMNPITLDVSASFAESDYQNASAGTYTDTVTITVSP